LYCKNKKRAYISSFRRTIGDVVGELRIVPKGETVWSIMNQMNIMLTRDV